jgi:hypothetical protein
MNTGFIFSLFLWIFPTQNIYETKILFDSSIILASVWNVIKVLHRLEA